MGSELRSRLALLVGLTLLGVGLAGVATAVGAPAALTAADPGTAFVVSEENVTVEHGDQQTTVAANTTHLDRIMIEQRGSGTYHVDTETAAPLTASDRSHAKAIARTNATVRQALTQLDAYTLTVSPIRNLTTDSAQAVTITGLATNTTDEATATADETFTISVNDTDTDTVTIDRDPEYVEHEARVSIRNPATDERYVSATVNFQNETVIDVTDWRSP